MAQPVSHTIASTTSSVKEQIISPTINRFPQSQPSPQKSTHYAKPPDLIILSPWNISSPAQLDRYIKGYETLYPSSSLAILSSNQQQQNSRVLSQPCQGEQQASLDDISGVIKTILKTTKPHDHRATFLLHLFGNTGAAQACHLLRAYKTETGETLNLKTVVFDTEPSLSVRAHQYFTSRRQQRQRQRSSCSPVSTFWTLLSALWASLLYFFSNLATSLGTFSVDDNVRRDLNDVRLVPLGARRCYVLPSNGLVFSWREEEGEERKDWAVERDRVGRDGCRWGVDDERFWGAIEEAWEEGRS